MPETISTRTQALGATVHGYPLGEQNPIRTDCAFCTATRAVTKCPQALPHVG